MNSRRSLTDALQLNAEKLAFINGDSHVGFLAEHEPQTISDNRDRQRPQQIALSSGTDTDAAISNVPSMRKTRKRVASAPNASQETTKSPPSEAVGMTLANVLIPLTTRLHPDTALALKRASLEQRLRGRSPATVQEIVEESVSRWLQSHGYLKPP